MQLYDTEKSNQVHSIQSNHLSGCLWFLSWQKKLLLIFSLLFSTNSLSLSLIWCYTDNLVRFYPMKSFQKLSVFVNLTTLRLKLYSYSTNKVMLWSADGSVSLFHWHARLEQVARNVCGYCLPLNFKIKTNKKWNNEWVWNAKRENTFDRFM